VLTDSRSQIRLRSMFDKRIALKGVLLTHG
jgi:hypothetical protein